MDVAVCTIGGVQPRNSEMRDEHNRSEEELFKSDLLLKVGSHSSYPVCLQFINLCNSPVMKYLPPQQDWQHLKTVHLLPGQPVEHVESRHL